MKMFGPALGYTLASFCLKIFIEPSKTPVITTEDPRWIGAWWIGTLILGVICTLTAFLISLFPKRMPRFVAKTEFQKKSQEMEKILKGNEMKSSEEVDKEEEDDKADKVPMSMADLWTTTMRILKNKIFMLNLIGIIFYFYGVFPYWIFLSKYIEVQYRTSASEAK